MSDFRQSSLPEHSGSRASQSALAQNRVLRNTYMLLALSMVPTILGALIGLRTGINQMMGGSPAVSAVVFLVGAFGLMYMVERNKNSSLGVVFLMAFTFFMGLMLSRLLGFVLGMQNGSQLIMMAFGGTAAVFAVMASVAASAKRDFSGMQKFLFIGAVILILAALGNIFFQMTALTLVISTMAIGIFSAFLLIDLQRIMRGGETNYISATLAVYLDVYNIFSNLLVLLGITGGNND